MRDKELIQQIKDATSLIELIGQSVKLRQHGNGWIGLCPFHSERTPSFNVIPDKGFFHCFGCNKHGDAFTWLMEREGLSFAEAKEQLARAAGIELPKFSSNRNHAKEEIDGRIRSALELAQSYFQRKLNEGGAARDYLRQRGINDAFAEIAGFGFAPDAWENVVNLLRQHGYSPELIEQTGLAVRNDRGNLRDFMRNRLTIPIHDTRGRLIAFGGRDLGNNGPKYLNTRETQLFKKSETLFGFHHAKGHIGDGALLVEGYFDVLQLHQEGISQAVAPLGTALTKEQLKAINRFTKKIVLCFDGDAAGQKATEKSLKSALELSFDIRILQLQSNEDPDTWCMKLGVNACREKIRNAPDWVVFLLDRAREGRDLKKISDRMEVFQTFVAFFAFMPRTPENWSMLQSVAAELSIPKHELNRALNLQAGLKGQNSDIAQDIAQGSAAENIEIDDLLRPVIILCRNEDARQEIHQIPASWWDYLKGAPILQSILDDEGGDSLLSVAQLHCLRKLEAVWAQKGDSVITVERAKFNLERAFISRELRLVAKDMKDSEIPADSEAGKRLAERQALLLQRKSSLSRR